MRMENTAHIGHVRNILNYQNKLFVYFKPVK